MNNIASRRTGTRRVPGAVTACLLVVLALVAGGCSQLLRAYDAEHATVLDDSTPAVTRLDPALLGALRRAAADAADDGVVVHVNSGWRSAKHQDELLRQAVAQYGSKAEAARWVATATTSPHVSGDAVDLGPAEATAWLSAHGARYGLCQIYDNEPWHYELRPAAVDHGCPARYADPTQDPRMQQGGAATPVGGRDRPRR